MRAVAVLGLSAGEADVAAFRVSGAEVRIADKIEACDAALIFGGDGTMHRHLPELHRLQVPALAVPGGSGNDFAHALGIDRVGDAVRAWKDFVAGKNNVRTIDLGCIEETGAQETKRATTSATTNDTQEPRSTGTKEAGAEVRHLFCCVGGAGLDADANRRANAMPRWLRRHGGYMLAATLAIVFKHPAHMRAYAASPEGVPLLDADEEAEFAAFANAPAYGDALLIAPGAKLDDGRLDLVYVRKASRLRLLRVAPRILTGRHIELPEVWFARAAEMRLECDPPRSVYADGEYCCETPVRVSVIAGGLRVVVAEANAK